MKMERIDENKVKVFISESDLHERGLIAEEMWDHADQIEQVFGDLFIECQDSLGFVPDGIVSVEVFALPTKGMIVLLTASELDEEESNLDMIEMRITLDIYPDLLYYFASWEDVISCAKALYYTGINAGTVYHFEERYYLFFTVFEVFEHVEKCDAIISEWGEQSTISPIRLEEYGKVIFSKQAIQQIYHYFLK
ncbi:MAG: adaptor protein MecA [Bacilli bacterium]